MRLPVGVRIFDSGYQNTSGSGALVNVRKWGTIRLTYHAGALDMCRQAGDIKIPRDEAITILGERLFDALERHDPSYEPREWRKLSDQERLLFESCVEDVLSRRALVLVALFE